MPSQSVGTNGKADLLADGALRRPGGGLLARRSDYTSNLVILYFRDIHTHTHMAKYHAAYTLSGKMVLLGR